jgi:hypothetical protein
MFRRRRLQWAVPIMRALTSRALMLLVLLLVAGCSAITPRNALPEAAAARSEPAGFHSIRYWGDETGLDAGRSGQRGCDGGLVHAK